MKLSSIMTEEVVTVGMDDFLKTICGIFDDKRFHHLLVVEDDELRGVISDRDVLKASSPFLNTLSEQNRDTAVLRKRAHQLMSRKPITITKEASSEDAVRLMLREDISCLPVLSLDGQIEGMITRKDLLNAYSQQVDLA
ncbi:MAG: CBS domain-containing protein [Phycisphaerales bacterium]